MKLTYLLLLVVLQICSLVEAFIPTIRLYGDVRRHKEFFAVMFPYLMDHLGPHVKVDYNILGHGIYAAAHLCAVKQTHGNNFLAAYYLKCEAEGRNPNTCLCESGIDEWEYRKCVRNEGNSLTQQAYWNYAQAYGGDWMPIIEHGPLIWKATWSVQGYQQNTTAYWTNLCTLYDKNTRPWICYNPLDVKPMKPGVTRYSRCDEKKNVTTKTLRSSSYVSNYVLTKPNLLGLDEILADGNGYYNETELYDELSMKRNLRKYRYHYHLTGQKVIVNFV